MHRPVFRTAFAVAACAAFLLGTAAAPDAAARQQDPPAKPAAPSVDRKAVLTEVYELGLLQSIVPLKLTAAQRDQVLTALKEIAETDRERRAKDDAALQAIAPEVTRARAAALEGTPVSAEMKAKLEEVGKASDARAAQGRRAAVATLLPLLRDSLSDAQKDEVDRQSVAFFGGKRVPAKYKANPNEAPRAEVLDLSMTAFIERVLLDDAAIGLLSMLKPVGGAPAAPATDGAGN